MSPKLASSSLGTALVLLSVVLVIQLVGSVAGEHEQTVLHGVSEGLNPKLTNLVASNKITLHYNGSGPVPSEGQGSPSPIPISPLNCTSLVEDAAVREIIAIYDGLSFTEGCSRCIAAFSAMHLLAMTQPVSAVIEILIRVCELVPAFRAAPGYATNCRADFGQPGGLGAWYAMMLSQMSMATKDMHSWCAHMAPTHPCGPPPAIEVNENEYFSPKPSAGAFASESPGDTFDVLHLSDLHFDPRFDVGAEGNCSQYGCCRPYSANLNLGTFRENASIPASRFGDYQCDSPPDLVLSAFESMSDFLDVSKMGFTIFTGDIVSHDRDKSLSRAYVAYEEETTYSIFAKFLHNMPVYVTLGNHDSMPRAWITPHNLNQDPDDPASNPMSWNYALVSKIWQKHHWLSEAEAAFASSHYGGYATTTTQGLRIISFNSDFWFKDNIFNYINSTNPDPSSTLKWVASELEACEQRGQRAWLITHVLSGYDGEAALPNPTALFYSIVRRFSPHTIAAIFFGHTHMDQVQLFYDFLPESLSESGLRNTSMLNYSAPIQTGYIGPSITPLTGLNSGYRLYTIDAKTFLVLDYKTYFANISDSLSWHRPVWQHLYSTREAYTKYVPWLEEASLNASFWHKVTEKMLEDSDEGRALFDMYEYYERKGSKFEGGRGKDVSREEKVCYLRNGQGGDRCQRLYGS